MMIDTWGVTLVEMSYFIVMPNIRDFITLFPRNASNWVLHGWSKPRRKPRRISDKAWKKRHMKNEHIK